MSEFRKRIIQPVSIPILAATFIGALVFSFSRILLAIPEKGSTTVALLMAAEILGVCSVIASIARVNASQKIVLVAFGLALIGGGAGAAEIGVRKIEQIGVTVNVTAKGIKFLESQLQFPADSQVTLKFDNQDAGVPHNVVITSDEAGLQSVFDPKGTVSGVATASYVVPPLKEGTYFFHCAVHPIQMKGQVIVGKGGAAPVAAPSVVPSPTESAMETGGPASTSTEIIAQGIQFTTTSVELLAGKTDTIHFTNNDTGVPHNVVITTLQNGGKTIFRKDPVTGPTHIQWTLSAPKAGTYYFHCEIHPNMQGTIVFK